MFAAAAGALAPLAAGLLCFANMRFRLPAPAAALWKLLAASDMPVIAQPFAAESIHGCKCASAALAIDAASYLESCEALDLWPPA